MEIRADEISRIIREQIQDYGKKVTVAETGTVLTVGDGIARVYGLEGVLAGELVEFKNGVKGLVLNLEEDNVGVAIMGEFSDIREGDTVKRTQQIASVPVGKALLGRVVNALGEPIDGKGPINATETPPPGDQGPRHREAEERARADADRHQGARRAGADRPRPARADHRRPPDRQDRGGDRHDHQPEGQERLLHLRRHRAEAVHRGAGGGEADPLRRHGVHDRGRGQRLRPGADAVLRAVHRRAPWASTSATTRCTP